LGTSPADTIDFGGYTSHIVVPADVAVPVPGAVPIDVAAAMESYLTLAFATTHRVKIEAGDHVVVLGAGGGIGQASVDVARSLGAHVVAVASTEDKRAAAKEAGAEVVLGYDNLKDDIRADDDRHGPHRHFDAGGGKFRMDHTVPENPVRGIEHDSHVFCQLPTPGRRRPHRSPFANVRYKQRKSNCEHIFIRR
jgi:threonine dehydrogenase-like Zn-dependent dehydrogenase